MNKAKSGAGRAEANNAMSRLRFYEGAGKVAGIAPTLDLDEALKTPTTMGGAVDFIAETTELSFDAPEALAFYIGYHAGKTVDFCAT